MIPRVATRSGDLPSQLETMMRIYVDAAIHRWRGKLWCHMFSPNIDHLHRFAQEIGMRREWFQDPRASSKITCSHYDISAQRRQIALDLGAIAVGRHQTIAMSRVAINRYFGVEGTDQAIDPLGLHRRLNSPAIERVEKWLSQELDLVA